MKTVKVAVSDLLTHLKANREKHISDYTELMVEYRKAVIEAFATKLKAAKKEEDVHHTIDVIRPADYTESYDTAITQLEWTVDTEVDLDQHEFAQYVEDKWSWSNMFTQTQRAYGKV
jgi:hypothetical protein